MWLFVDVFCLSWFFTYHREIFRAFDFWHFQGAEHSLRRYMREIEVGPHKSRNVKKTDIFGSNKLLKICLDHKYASRYVLVVFKNFCLDIFWEQFVRANQKWPVFFTFTTFVRKWWVRFRLLVDKKETFCKFSIPPFNFINLLWTSGIKRRFAPTTTYCFCGKNYFLRLFYRFLKFLEVFEHFRREGTFLSFLRFLSLWNFDVFGFAKTLKTMPPLFQLSINWCGFLCTVLLIINPPLLNPPSFSGEFSE